MILFMVLFRCVKKLKEKIRKKEKEHMSLKYIQNSLSFRLCLFIAIV